MAKHQGLVRWHEYMASHGDLALLSAMVVDDAVFHSPVVHTPQVGKAKVMAHYLFAQFKERFWETLEKPRQALRLL